METHVANNRFDGHWGGLRLPNWWQGQHRDLDYIHEPFNNPADVESWNMMGYTQTRFTGDMYDMRFSEPEWIEGFRYLLPMRYFSWSVYRMRPGDVLPLHSDTYARFCSLHGIKDIGCIRRYVIFLDDWASGHYFEIAGQPLTQWQAGDAVYWHGDVQHLAANIGHTPRYTLQLTGIIDHDVLETPDRD